MIPSSLELKQEKCGLTQVEYDRLVPRLRVDLCQWVVR